MKPFEYCAPGSISEAVDLLADKGEKARLLAGGTDLLVQLRLGLCKLDLVIDVKRIPELKRISFDPAEGLIVGAAVTCADLCEHPNVVEAYPGLVNAVSIIGGTAIQGRATIGGNLCNAAPSGDSIPAMIVLGGECTIAGPQGTRSVAVEDFCLGSGQTVLQKGEMLVSFHFSPPKPGSGACYLRFTPRREMDLAVAGVGAWVLLDRDRAKILDARIALGAVAPKPLLVDAAGKALIGKEPNEDAFTVAAEIAQDAAKPITDMRGTQPQRRHLVGVLVKRALRGALKRITANCPVRQNVHSAPEQGGPDSG